MIILKQINFWGKGIFFFYVLFIIIMLTAANYMASTKIDLVDDNYYSLSDQYQKTIDAEERTHKLSEKPKIIATKTSLSISLPQKQLMAFLKTNLSFYSPSSAKEDIQIKPNFDSNGYFEYETQQLRKGDWEIIFTWLDLEGKSYYLKERIKLK